VIRCCTGNLFAALHVEPVGFPDLRYFFSHLCDALFDGLLHEDRLAEHPDKNRSSKVKAYFQWLYTELVQEKLPR
jgi:hypothetical protein